jgi:hypothetical protein
MTTRTNASATQRLGNLPEIFSGGDLTVRFGWTSGIASSYLAHWRKAGLVKSLGGRADVHMNLVVNLNANPLAALSRAYPQAVKVGIDILREAGWTTQIPTCIDIALPANYSLHDIEGFSFTKRNAVWFSRVRPGTVFVENGIHQLKAAWALADMLARAQDLRVRGAWLPDPEDMDWHSVRADKHLANALAAFALPRTCLEGSGFEKIYDALALHHTKLATRASAADFRTP